MRIPCRPAFWILATIAANLAAAAEPVISEREGVPTIDWHDAGKHVNERVLVQGRIVATKNTGSICFLNFDATPARAFTAIVRKSSFDKFPEKPEKAYLEKNVRILGTISEFQGKTQIVVSSPDQIEVLADLPPIAPPAAAPRPAAGDTGILTLATFNVMNLFDEYDDPYHEDEGTPAKPRAQLEHLAATLRQINADVIALEEVENRFYLERFVKAMVPDMGYREIVGIESNDARGIECAVLSRVPVGPVTSYRHVRFKDAEGHERSFERDLLRVRLEPAGAPPFDLFVVHLKSKGSGPTSDVLREAEAKAARRVLDEAMKQDSGARLAICGDFNDTWDSASLRAIRGEGAGEFKTFFEELPANARITFNQEPHREMIDFILCSPALAKTHVAGSFRIYPGSPETTGSDHNPVATQFRMK